MYYLDTHDDNLEAIIQATNQSFSIGRESLQSFNCVKKIEDA